ncbi:hypothetical protein [Mycobacterium attenuatum]|uniref:hypothetical protein n=1 Tax=Mycobacterium attenuatum TaxID=2341086 RepID=UPI000F03C8AA|nr:hypothetical protein [Mycobacterium attenuatum]VBA47123.1 hypothetical protein LAUMK41_00486 [Mycobacterium attenuatum]
MDDDEKPTMTETELWEWLHYDEVIPVTRRTIKWAVLRREIIPTRLGNGNFFSKRDGLEWLKSRKQPETAPTRNYAAESHAAQP